MRKALLAAVAVTAASLTLSTPAQAQIFGPATCGLNEVTFHLALNPDASATACAGWYLGNDSNQPAVVATALGYFQDNYSFPDSWAQLEKVEGPGGDDEWGTSEGPFAFASPYTDFAVAVKAGRNFSLYYYQGTADAFSFNLTAVKNGGSHYAVYGGRTTSVPEPGTMLLMGTGLLGLVMIRRREEDV